MCAWRRRRLATGRRRARRARKTKAGAEPNTLAGYLASERPSVPLRLQLRPHHLLPRAEWTQACLCEGRHVTLCARRGGEKGETRDQRPVTTRPFSLVLPLFSASVLTLLQYRRPSGQLPPAPFHSLFPVSTARPARALPICAPPRPLQPLLCVLSAGKSYPVNTPWTPHPAPSPPTALFYPSVSLAARARTRASPRSSSLLPAPSPLSA